MFHTVGVLFAKGRQQGAATDNMALSPTRYSPAAEIPKPLYRGVCVCRMRMPIYRLFYTVTQPASQFEWYVDVGSMVLESFEMPPQFLNVNTSPLLLRFSLLLTNTKAVLLQ